MDPVIIIGGGHAGGAAAVALRNYGFAGPIAIIGAERVPPYERPALSKGFLADECAAPQPVAPDWAAHNVELRLGATVANIDRRRGMVETGGGARIPYGKLVVATGASPKSLPYPNLSKLFYLRTIADAENLRRECKPGRHTLVIGGGVIGLEVAATAREMGLEVCVLEAGRRIMARNAPPEIAKEIAALHERHGVQILCDIDIAAISETSDRIVVMSSDGEFRGDFAVAGIGVAPATQLAERAGLEVRDGIVVNAAYQTQDPDIYAIGDVAALSGGEETRTTRLETWDNANQSADIAAASIAGVPPTKPRTSWFWTDQYGCNIQIAGNHCSADSVVTRKSGGKTAFFYYRSETLIGAATIDSGSDMAILRRLLDAGLSPIPEEAADPSFSLRDFLRQSALRN